MDKTRQLFHIEGIDCANCAQKIVSKIRKLSDVIDADMNFALGELSVYTNTKDVRTLQEKIINTIIETEPHSKVYTEDAVDIQIDNHSNKKKILTLIISGILFLFGFTIHLLYHPEPEFSFLFISSTLALGISYGICGFEVIVTAVRNIFKGDIFNENFLMFIATVGAIVIGEYPEAAVVMLFYNIGEFFQDLAVNNSKKSIKALLNIKPDYANIKKNGSLVKVKPIEVKKGSVIVVLPGERIPLDGIIIKGTGSIDTSTLTGESVPYDVFEGDTVLSGSICVNSVLEIKTTKEFGESTVSLILEMVQYADEKKARTERFITRFAKIYTPVVVLIAAFVAFFPPFFTDYSWSEWLQRGLVFLVVSCPCALVISVPLSYFGGIGRASKEGILIKGSNYFEVLANASHVVFDKTGTLTKGEFHVKSVHPNQMSETQLLEYAAIAEQYSTHPIALSIKRAFNRQVDVEALSEYQELSGEGIRVNYKGVYILAGNERLMNRYGITCETVEDTHVHVAVNDKYAGYIVVEDQLKPNAAKTVSELKNRGIKKISMLTGDKMKQAQSYANVLGITDVRAELLPQDKIKNLEEIMQNKDKREKTIFVGDGINDAPALARSDVGVAMGALGSESAIEAADIVLMNDDPMQLVRAIDIAKKTKFIVLQNIVFALVVKLIVQVLGVLGYASMWAGVFADVGVSLLAILNAMRILKMKKNN
jgi:Cd2+/Zn2+-exporting ATPase